MERRSFVQASLATLGAATAGHTLAADAKPSSGDLYELRTYSLKTDKQAILDDYLSKALIPTLKKFGIGPVGVFSEKDEAKDKKETTKLYVLIVFKAAEQFATLSARLADDEEYRKAGGEYLAARASDPPYLRIESSLLTAIDGMPKLEKPDTTKARLFNLRIYESHNERAGKKKIEMFNKSELAIFKRDGLTPVFFGETILGSLMPNLTYMLVFADEEARKAAWGKFVGDPDWQKLKALPEYADKEIVSRITNKLLLPAAYSEI